MPAGIRGVGLVDVPSDRLRTLLRAVYREETTVPVTPASIAALGLQDWQESVLGHLRGLDAKAIHAVLVAVLAERGHAPR
ncbi:MAG: hypothetical protein AAGA54_15690 [Myxococcota bacterium]